MAAGLPLAEPLAGRLLVGEQGESSCGELEVCLQLRSGAANRPGW